MLRVCHPKAQRLARSVMFSRYGIYVNIFGKSIGLIDVSPLIVINCIHLPNAIMYNLWALIVVTA